MIKRLSFCLVAPLVLAAGVSAAPSVPPDVPAKHWAAPSVHRLAADKILGTQPDGKFHGDQPVTRYELAVALDRFVQYIEAGRRPLHATEQSAGKLNLNGSPALQRLIYQGFLPVSTPLARGKGTETVTARQLSDALAQVTVRLSDRSLPPNKD